jgi:hypothetical protein
MRGYDKKGYNKDGATDGIRMVDMRDGVVREMGGFAA